jgi:uncharacterized protein (TIGR00255 family)
MQSMTGFGEGEATAGDFGVSCEVRSVNHRFLDVSLRLPAAISFCESDVRNRVKERLARGRVTIAFQIAPLKDIPLPAVSAERIERAIVELELVARRLAAATGRDQEIRLEHLLAVPDLFGGEESAAAPPELGASVLGALDKALDRVLAMKESEGRELARELRERLAKLRGLLAEVERQAPRSATETHERLRTRVAQLAGEEVDPQRLAQEVALLADRANINEECERFGVHLDSFAATLDQGGQVAKRLNFLLQEMHREVNTMGSKTNLMEITQAVIAMKEEVESMREQVQNLE